MDVLKIPNTKGPNAKKGKMWQKIKEKEMLMHALQAAANRLKHHGISKPPIVFI